jgi:hypothetical protein
VDGPDHHRLPAFVGDCVFPVEDRDQLLKRQTWTERTDLGQYIDGGIVGLLSRRLLLRRIVMRSMVPTVRFLGTGSLRRARAWRLTVFQIER